LKDTFNSKHTLKDFLIGDSKKLKEILEDYRKLSSNKKEEFKKKFNPYFINQYEQKLAVTPKKEENIYKYKNIKY